MRKTYPTDLSDAEWGYIEPHLPTPRRAAGRSKRHFLRKKILDADFYILVRSGCAWRLLAHEFPPWKSATTTTTSEPGTSTAPEREVHVAKVVDQEGVKPLLEYAKEELFSRLWHL
jgi:transposase